MSRLYPVVVAGLLSSPLIGFAAVLSPIPDRITPVMPAAYTALDPSAVAIQGWLGARLDANIAHRLLVIDTGPMLAGFRKKPGEQAWIGEHVGKWLDAATLAWAYTGDAALRRKLDEVASQLIATQEPDGYLGTYLPGRRFGLYDGADWDVWTHSYDMIGLLTYYRYTGNPAALAASRRVADLLIRTFPSQRSIVAAGQHRGMAATSVLEPIVTLYRLTGEDRYLAFARYIVGAYDEPGGPAIVRSLAAGRDVSQTANGKAYEMLCNLMGLCDLARVTGDQTYLRAVLNAWDNIVAHHLYLTGSASDHEVFIAPEVLPNGVDAHLGETCVTTTWIQLNLQLLQLTGRPAFGDEIERSLYNHLASAQNPQGDDWCYYTALEGKKQYDSGITCCHSSGPRALALCPSAAYLQQGSDLRISTFETSQAQFRVGDQMVRLEQEGAFPDHGHSTLTVRCAHPVALSLFVRVPAWAAPLQVHGQDFAEGWAPVAARTFKDGDKVEIDYHLSARIIPGKSGNAGHVAYAWGPFILAADAGQNAGLPRWSQIKVAAVAPQRQPRTAGPLAFWVAAQTPTPARLSLLPYADAGSDGTEYRVWLPSAN